MPNIPRGKTLPARCSGACIAACRPLRRRTASASGQRLRPAGFVLPALRPSPAFWRKSRRRVMACFHAATGLLLLFCRRVRQHLASSASFLVTGFSNDGRLSACSTCTAPVPRRLRAPSPPKFAHQRRLSITCCRCVSLAMVAKRSCRVKCKPSRKTSWLTSVSLSLSAGKKT